mgnify:CR=1 FL=1
MQLAFPGVISAPQYSVATKHRGVTSSVPHGGLVDVEQGMIINIAYTSKA